jgi:hypothetical protein
MRSLSYLLVQVMHQESFYLTKVMMLRVGCVPMVG